MPRMEPLKPAEPEEEESDPFAPPYNPNLFVGFIQEENQEEYVILVRGHHSIFKSPDINTHLTDEQVLSCPRAFPANHEGVQIPEESVDA